MRRNLLYIYRGLWTWLNCRIYREVKKRFLRNEDVFRCLLIRVALAIKADHEATIECGKYLSCHTLSLSNRMLKPCSTK